MNKEKIKIFKRIDLSNKKAKSFILIAIAILVLALSVLVAFKYSKLLHANIYYRTYNKDTGWTKWVKNGKECGVEGKYISAIEVKVKSRYNGHVFYNTYYNSKWSTKNTYDGKTSGNKKDSINGLNVLITDNLYDRYSVYYSTHNKKDGWMLYNKNGNTSGNAKEKIDKIKIIISVKDDYEYEKIEIGKTRFKNFE